MNNRELQRNVINAVLRLMETRQGEQFTDFNEPDKIERRKKAVDLRVKGRHSEYVLEHTLIESFPEQILDNKQPKRLLDPIIKKLNGTLPGPGSYQLIVETCAVKGAKNGEKIRIALIDWIRNKTPGLKMGVPPHHFIKATPQGVPFEVMLRCIPGTNGRFRIRYLTPENLKKKRCARIRRALDQKLPKLQAAKEDGAISVLVLESNDISLGCPEEIAGTVIREISNRRKDVLDEIYLIETDIQSRCIWVLQEKSKFFIDIEDRGSHYIEL